MSEHKLLFSLVVLASFVSLGWVLIIYVLSFHAAQRLVDRIGVDYGLPRRELRSARYTERSLSAKTVIADSLAPATRLDHDPTWHPWRARQKCSPKRNGPTLVDAATR
jgi:hypothetical protein